MACRMYLPLTLLVLSTTTDAANILGIFLAPYKSHVHSYTPLMEELANRGHNVTVITRFPMSPPVKNKIYDDDFFEDLQNFTGFGANMENNSMWEIVSVSWKVMNEYWINALQHPHIQELIQGKGQHFDVMFVEPLFHEFLYSLSYKLEVPLIQVVPYGLDMILGDSVGNVHTLSYIPSVFTTFPSKMTFTQRFINTLGGSFLYGLHEFVVLPLQERAVRSYFKDPSMPSISEIAKNTSLMFVTSHFTTQFPRPFTPNTIEVAGMHIRPVKKLPKDLQQYLDEAPEGVVYFSFGSIVRASDMPDEMRQAVFTVFSKIKQKVLCKWETDSIPGQPKNVKLAKWLPQNDILAHPNVRAFISHGGLLGGLEALYHGVPIVMIPVFGDQEKNAYTAERQGYVIRLEIGNVTVESLSWALNELLNNPSYRDKVKQMSTLYRDQPQTPMERAVYWTEYVIRHKGARHMRSAALDLWWFQYYLLDVLAVLLGAVVLIIAIIWLSCRTLYRLAFRKKPVKYSKAKKKN